MVSAFLLVRYFTILMPMEHANNVANIVRPVLILHFARLASDPICTTMPVSPPALQKHILCQGLPARLVYLHASNALAIIHAPVASLVTYTSTITV